MIREAKHARSKRSVRAHSPRTGNFSHWTSSVARDVDLHQERNSCVLQVVANGDHQAAGVADSLVAVALVAHTTLYWAVARGPRILRSGAQKHVIDCM